MMIVGTIENWLHEKAMEAWDEDTMIGKVKFVICSVLSGVPAGLCINGIMLWMLIIVEKLTGKKLEFVDN